MLIKKLQQVAWDIWKDRNDALYDEKKGLVYQEEKENVLRQFESGFDFFPASVRALTRKMHSQVLAMKPEDRAAWLHSIAAARNVAEHGPIADERRQLQLQRRLMHRHVVIEGDTVRVRTTAAAQRHDGDVKIQRKLKHNDGR